MKNNLENLKEIMIPGENLSVRNRVLSPLLEEKVCISVIGSVFVGNMENGNKIEEQEFPSTMYIGYKKGTMKKKKDNRIHCGREDWAIF